MRVLVVTAQLPRFPGSGSATRQFCLLRELTQRHEMTVCPIVWPGNERYLEALGKVCAKVEPVLLDQGGETGSARVKIRSTINRSVPLLMPVLRAIVRTAATGRERLSAAVRALSLTPQGILPAHAICRSLSRVLERLLTQGYDVVQVEQLYLAHCLPPETPGTARLLVLHDINSTIRSRRLKLEVGLLRRMSALAEWKKMRRYERRMVDAYRNCVVVSEEERDALRALKTRARIWIAPNGVDTAYFHMDSIPAAEPDSLVFTGSMVWEPNVDAMSFFCERILPIIRSRRPQVRLHIVGANPPESIRRLSERGGIVVTGEVPDVRPYLARASVCVVPLRFGAGTRLKILDALAMGKAVVSTSIGCEGLRLSHGRELLVADTPESFADAVFGLLEDGRQRAALGVCGRKVMGERYDWRTIALQQDEVYREIAENRAQ